MSAAFTQDPVTMGVAVAAVVAGGLFMWRMYNKKSRQFVCPEHKPPQRSPPSCLHTTDDDFDPLRMWRPPISQSR